MKTGTHVLVTTEHRGVFAGVLQDQSEDGSRITLTRCRMAVYWDTGMRGVIGLASVGPSDRCKISPASPGLAELSGVTMVAEISDEAWARWEAEPWSE